MSRYTGAGSYGHRVRSTAYPDEFVIRWTYDRYYSGSRLRFPQCRERWTDRKGALRFAKKWGLRGKDSGGLIPEKAGRLT
jgi:hypothetical protein